MGEITLGQLWGWLLAAAAGIVTLAKVWDIIRDRMKPQKELREKVDTLSRTVERESDNVKKVDERLDDLEDAIGVIMRSQLAIIDHEISGDHVTNLQMCKDELVEYLTRR